MFLPVARRNVQTNKQTTKTMKNKTYSSASNAKRAAKAAGLALDAFDILTDKSGGFYYEARKPVAPVKLTSKENDLLHALQVGMDSPGTGWLHELVATTSSNAGVVASLSKKGLLKSTEEEKGMRYLEITTLGAATATTAPAKTTKPKAEVAVKGTNTGGMIEEEVPLLRKSQLQNPVEWVWNFFDQQKAKADAKGEKISRKGAIALAVAKGIAFYTARTQYQSWKTANKF
jgi:hypothetical protein